jgi:hypothetical protein
MKKLIKITILLLIAGTLSNCNNDDDDNNTQQNSLSGKWEATSGSFLESQPKYLIFNQGNTLSFLSEHDLGFKTHETFNYTLSGSVIEINIQGGPRSFQYVLNGNTLSIDDGFSTLHLVKNNIAPNTGDWVQELSVLSEGNAPWNGEVDIAFTYDKTNIVYGMNPVATYIPLIDPMTFFEVGQIATTNQANVVEVEKSSLTGRFLFQSNGNSNIIKVYTMDDGAFQFNLDVDSEISGMASVDSNYLWVVSNNDQGSINLINVADNTIEQTVLLGYRGLYGLDYQNGFLYVSDGTFLHKCQTTPAFKSVKSYRINGFDIYGIAFDGTNFWASTYSNVASNYKLVKTNLSL